MIARIRLTHIIPKRDMHADEADLLDIVINGNYNARNNEVYQNT
jgi:hypothetical protein